MRINKLLTFSNTLELCLTFVHFMLHGVLSAQVEKRKNLRSILLLPLSLCLCPTLSYPILCKHTYYWYLALPSTHTTELSHLLGIMHSIFVSVRPYVLPSRIPQQKIPSFDKLRFVQCV